MFKGESTVGFDTGTWQVTDNQYCRVQIFDRNGLVDARLTE
jgi:hypothetical protein